MTVYYVDFGAQASALDTQTIRVRRQVAKKQTVVKRRRLLLSMFALFVVLALQLSFRIYITEKGYEIERMRMIALNNDTELRELGFAYAYQTRPSELIRLAEERLAMEPLQPAQIRKVN